MVNGTSVMFCRGPLPPAPFEMLYCGLCRVGADRAIEGPPDTENTSVVRAADIHADQVDPFALWRSFP